MRVVNDREEKTEPSAELGILQVVSYALFCAAGISTFVFCPVPIILAHLRLSDGQAKLSGLLGALIALTLLEIPLNIVLLTFVFGLFIGDEVAKKREFWKLLLRVGAVAGLVAFAILSIQATSARSALIPYWHHLVTAAVDQLKMGVQNPGAFKWGQLESLLFYEGPFLYLSVALISFWLSVGVIAHLGWFPEMHPFRAESLRKNRMPAWVVLLFVVLAVSSFVGPSQAEHFTSGLFRLVGSLFFIQGCITLSGIMARKRTKARLRILVYSFSIVFGFYVLVAIGLVGPWYTKWRDVATQA